MVEVDGDLLVLVDQAVHSVILAVQEMDLLLVEVVVEQVEQGKLLLIQHQREGLVVLD